MAGFQPGEPVTLMSIPPSLLRGLPDEDQAAIRFMIGKTVIFVGLSHGQAEVEFKDDQGDHHTIWVEPDRLRPAVIAKAS